MCGTLGIVCTFFKDSMTTLLGGINYLKQDDKKVFYANL
jgi:hypothetical protein